jgi:hypothetical protein
MTLIGLRRSTPSWIQVLIPGISGINMNLNKSRDSILKANIQADG